MSQFKKSKYTLWTWLSVEGFYDGFMTVNDLKQQLKQSQIETMR